MSRSWQRWSEDTARHAWLPLCRAVSCTLAETTCDTANMTINHEIVFHISKCPREGISPHHDGHTACQRARVEGPRAIEKRVGNCSSESDNFADSGEDYSEQST